MKIALHQEGLASDSTFLTETECLLAPVKEQFATDPARMSGNLAMLNTLSGGAVRRLFELGDFKARVGNVLLVPELPELKKRVLFVGVGKTELDEQGYDRALRIAFTRLSATKVKHVTILLDDIAVKGRDLAWQLQHMVLRAQYANYRYSATRQLKEAHHPLGRLDVVGVANTAQYKKASKYGLAIAAGTQTARELGDLPANICTPEYLAKYATNMAKNLSQLNVTVFNEKKIRAMKMGALLSVSQGSIQPPYVITMEYRGADESQQPVALIGKGVCFDTGGISIKPSSAMDEMKYDMCGAASVIGTMEVVARLGLPLNVIGMVGAVENMPSDRATKPGDVVTSMSGKTIEVLNTDAEGRMVLSDLLHHVKDYRPACIVDIATLTGACVVALGKHACGLYSNRQDLADRLTKAGQSSVDRAWQMPLWPEYKKELRTHFADIANIGGRYAGSISAACFLYEFVGEEWAWAHLDIAGVAWHSGEAKGGTGRPVPLLAQFLIDF